MTIPDILSRTIAGAIIAAATGGLAAYTQLKGHEDRITAVEYATKEIPQIKTDIAVMKTQMNNIEDDTKEIGKKLDWLIERQLATRPR